MFLARCLCRRRSRRTSLERYRRSRCLALAFWAIWPWVALGLRTTKKQHQKKIWYKYSPSNKVLCCKTMYRDGETIPRLTCSLIKCSTADRIRITAFKSVGRRSSNTQSRSTHISMVGSRPDRPLSTRRQASQLASNIALESYKRLSSNIGQLSFWNWKKPVYGKKICININTRLI